MKQQKWELFGWTILAMIWELMPFGAVLNFASPDSEPIRQTVSYFDFTPFGYGVFGPLVTAILTCVLLLFTAIYLFADRKGLKTAISVISLITTLISLTPILYGIEFYSAVGAIISAILLMIFCISLRKEKTNRR